MILAVLLLAFATAYVACNRPLWALTMYICSLLCLEVLALLAGIDLSAIPLGSVLLRTPDAGTFGIVVGTLYHLHHEGYRVFRRKPLGSITLAILAYFGAKILWTVLFGQDQITANPTASHSLGGLVAAVGELRDNLVAFILPAYVYAARKSSDLKALGWPILVGTFAIFAKAAMIIAATGQIWSNDVGYRFLTAQEAITLTIFSFLLFFLRPSRLAPFLVRGIAGFGFALALIANHRSQWIAALAGTSVLLLVVLMGRPFVGNPKVNRLLSSGAAIVVVLTAAILSFFSGILDRFPILAVITVRLYAITEPSRDADAKWRQTIWQDRLRQVGSNWPWGRLLGDRRATLIHGVWLTVPDHSAYVAMYELGGVILCILVALFWFRVIAICLTRLKRNTSPSDLWPAAVALAICASSLAFGSGYEFPALAPALAVMLILGSGKQASACPALRSSGPTVRTVRLPVHASV